ncbi:hypothetical protein ACOME3_002820 [Neoechinorhynchus agilis]
MNTKVIILAVVTILAINVKSSEGFLFKKKTTTTPKPLAQNGIAALLKKTTTTTHRPYFHQNKHQHQSGPVQIPIQRPESTYNRDYKPQIGFKKNHCSPDPCLNNGVCTSLTTTYICRCMKGYYGMKCEKKFSSYN